MTKGQVGARLWDRCDKLQRHCNSDHLANQRAAVRGQLQTDTGSENQEIQYRFQINQGCPGFHDIADADRAAQRARAGFGLLQSREQPQQRRFAGAVGTDRANALASA